MNCKVKNTTDQPVDTNLKILKVGQELEVKLMEIDARTGNLKLSRKALMQRPPKQDNRNSRR